MKGIDQHVADVFLSEHERSRICACSYCGLTTDITRDHVIPVAWKGFGRYYERGDTIPSCRECNIELGSSAIFSVQERAAYLIGIYRRKHKKMLEMPDWSEEEIEEMDYSLAKSIRGAMLARDIITKRFVNLAFVADGNYEKISVRQKGLTFARDYKIMTFFISCSGSHQKRLAQTSEYLCEKYELVKLVIQGKSDINALNTFKHDHQIPFDVKLKDFK